MEQLLDINEFDINDKATIQTSPSPVFVDQDILNELNSLFKIYKSLPNRNVTDDNNINTAMTLVKNVISARIARWV